MIDVKLLDNAIRQSGKSYRHLANQLGISSSSFYNKRHGITEFSAMELHTLLTEIDADDYVKAKIFCSKQ